MTFHPRGCIIFIGQTHTYTLYGTACGLKYGGNTYYFYKNLQGDVIAITDNAGTVVARYTYDAWGKVLSVTDANGNAITSATHVANINPFRYRSYYYDAESRLYYLQSRYYDPEVGRFLNADDTKAIENVENVLTTNFYSYCQNNPINAKDNMGYITAQILARVILGIMIGFIVQLFCDLIEAWYFTHVKKSTTPYEPKPGDYLASMLTWSLSFLNPVSEKAELAIIIVPYIVKHLVRLLRNEFNWGTLIIDVVSAALAYIVNKCLKKATKNKLNKIEKVFKNKKNAAKQIAKKSEKINIKFSKLAVKFSFGITISNTIIQVIYDLFFD